MKLKFSRDKNNSKLAKIKEWSDIETDIFSNICKLTIICCIIRTLWGSRAAKGSSKIKIVVFLTIAIANVSFLACPPDRNFDFNFSTFCNVMVLKTAPWYLAGGYWEGGVEISLDTVCTFVQHHCFQVSLSAVVASQFDVVWRVCWTSGLTLAVNAPQVAPE